MSFLGQEGHIKFWSDPDEAISAGKSDTAIGKIMIEGNKRLIMFKKGQQPWLGYLSSPNLHIRNVTNQEIKSVRRWRNLKL